MSSLPSAEDTDALDDATEREPPQPPLWKLAVVLIGVAALIVAAMIGFGKIGNPFAPAAQPTMGWAGGAFPQAPTGTLPTFSTRVPATEPDPAAITAAFGLPTLKPVPQAKAAVSNGGKARDWKGHAGQMQVAEDYGVRSIDVARDATTLTGPDVPPSQAQALARTRAVLAACGVSADQMALTVHRAAQVTVSIQFRLPGGRLSVLDTGTGGASIGGALTFHGMQPDEFHLGLTVAASDGGVTPVGAKAVWDLARGDSSIAQQFTDTYVSARLVWTTIMSRHYTASRPASANEMLEPAWEFTSRTGSMLVLDADAQHAATVL